MHRRSHSLWLAGSKVVRPDYGVHVQRGSCVGDQSFPHLQQYPRRCSGVEETDLLPQDAAEIPLPEPVGLPDACVVPTERQVGNL